MKMTLDKWVNERKEAAGTLRATQVPRRVLASLNAATGTEPNAADTAGITSLGKVWLGWLTLLGDEALVKRSRQTPGKLHLAAVALPSAVRQLSERVATLGAEKRPAACNAFRLGAALLVFIHGTREETPNDPKLSDGRGWRGPCMAGGKAVAE